MELELPRVLAPDLSSNCYSMLDGFKYPPLYTPKYRKGIWKTYFFSLPQQFLGIGQFARLLPSVEVVAVSQAPSPESNPNPPLPSTPWQSTTRPSLADRAVVPQKTPSESAFARNELNQHYLVLLPRERHWSYFHSFAWLSHCPDRRTSRNNNGDEPTYSCISLAFRQGIQFCVTATFLRQITSDVMSHAQIPAKQ